MFVTVRERFGRPAGGLHLSPTERQVARLFYLEDKTVDQIAALLHIKRDTVHTYLQRIRDKAETVVGSRIARRIGAYLLQHPGEASESET